MKVLLITNNIANSNAILSSSIKIAWQNYILEDKRRAKNRNKSILDLSKELKTLDSKDKFTEFKEHNAFTPNVVFIVPELLWENDQVNEGYDVARELITHIYKGEFIQFVFLSVLDRAFLKTAVDIRNRYFVEAFPHYCLLDNDLNLKFDYYTVTHYNLIKYLAISDNGRLQKIGHEMSSVKANIQNSKNNIEQNKEDLLKQLDELTLFQAWSNKSIREEINKVKNIQSEYDLIKSEYLIEEIIDEINIKMPNYSADRNVALRNKSSYKILAVEDEVGYREFFFEILSKYYDSVYPDLDDNYFVDGTKHNFSISCVPELISKYGKKFNIFFLDLLYKDAYGNWLNFNGLDLYQLIKKVNPHAVIRIITSLPRGIVGKVVELIINSEGKPFTDQIFTKKYGFEALKDSIIDSIEVINSECKEKEKVKNQLIPMPKTGIFDQPGISDLMNTLLSTRLNEFKERELIAINLYNLYLESKLSLNTEKWNKGILGKGTSFSNPAEAFFLKKIVNVMVYRLITIDITLLNPDNRVHFDVFKDTISRFSRITGVDNPFFYSIGFSRNEQQSNKYFSPQLTNLLPHESLIVEARMSEKNQNLLLTNYPQLSRWVEESILNYDYLGKIWKALKISKFDWFKRTFDKKTITISQLITFFAHLYANYTDPQLAKVFYRVIECCENLPKAAEEELKNLSDLQMQIDLFTNSGNN